MNAGLAGFLIACSRGYTGTPKCSVPRRYLPRAVTNYYGIGPVNRPKGQTTRSPILSPRVMNALKYNPGGSEHASPLPSLADLVTVSNKLRTWSAVEAANVIVRKARATFVICFMLFTPPVATEIARQNDLCRTAGGSAWSISNGAGKIRESQCANMPRRLGCTKSYRNFGGRLPTQGRRMIGRRSHTQCGNTNLYA